MTTTTKPATPATLATFAPGARVALITMKRSLDARGQVTSTSFEPDGQGVFLGFDAEGEGGDMTVVAMVGRDDGTIGAEPLEWVRFIRPETAPEPAPPQPPETWDEWVARAEAEQVKPPEPHKTTFSELVTWATTRTLAAITTGERLESAMHGVVQRVGEWGHSLGQEHARRDARPEPEPPPFSATWAEWLAEAAPEPRRDPATHQEVEAWAASQIRAGMAREESLKSVVHRVLQFTTEWSGRWARRRAATGLKVALKWSDPEAMPGTTNINRCTAETPIGRIVITWCAWPNPGENILLSFSPWGAGAQPLAKWPDLTGAQAACEAEFNRRLSECISTAP